MVASSSADTPQVTVERNEHDVVVLTLNRPQARNAVSFDLWNDLDAAVREISQASPPRAVVLAAAGGFFCAGGDLKTPPSRGEGALAPAARLELGQQVMHRLRSLPVPVIAAVEGGAIGEDGQQILRRPAAPEVLFARVCGQQRDGMSDRSARTGKVRILP